jgi:hypothetical protein
MTNKPFAAFAFAVLSLPATAAEGLWTFDQPPVAALKATYGFAPDAAWLDHLQHSAVRFRASASFVSANGLVLTNHHVVLDCASKLSSAGHDIVRDGFVARTQKEELRCPGGEASVLERIEDVTAQVRAAEGAATDEAGRAAARRGAIAKIENDCKQRTGLSCQIVTLYQGAAYHLYQNKRYDDVRLVFAPEYQVGFYGGDPDNFVYPRFNFDVGLVRLYENGKPVRPKDFLRINEAGPSVGEPLFVAGHPGRTQHLMTEAQLKYLRDVENPIALASIRQRIAALKAYAATSPEAARRAKDWIFSYENWQKSLSGAQTALSQPAFFARKAEAERGLVEVSAGKIEGDPWREIEAVVEAERSRAKLDWLASFRRQGLLQRAGELVQLAADASRPDAERLPDYRDAALPSLRQTILAEEPYYKDLDLAMLLARAREATETLGADHPYTRALTGGNADPTAYLKDILDRTRLDDANERRRLLEGGAAAIAASDDPLIALAKALDPVVRETQRFNEEQVKGPIARAAARIEAARFAAYGHAVAPDATGTLRFSYGEAKGYDWYGIRMPWKTTIGGLYDRSASFDHTPPFELAPSWTAARKSLDPDTPLNYVLTADIVGGNSGSPIVNRKGELVGLIFDGNPSSNAIYYLYGEDTERAIAVHPRAIVEALDKVYKAPAIVRELRGRER